MIGSRYIAGGRLGDWNPVRKFLSAAAVWVTWPIQKAGMHAKDPMIGILPGSPRVRRADCLPALGFKLLLEILVRGHIRSVEEIPLAFGLRYRGASKANFKVAVDYGRLLVRLYASRFGLRRD